MKWIISANGKIYNHANAFLKWGYIDWRQNAKYSINDIVYIYCTKPDSKIMYKAKVTKINMNFNEITDDKEFWINIEEYNKSKSRKYTRLVLLEQVDNKKLELKNLIKHGLNSAPQGPVKVKDELAAYIDSNFNDYCHDCFFNDENDYDNLYEGHIKRVPVNKYERSSIARQKCIEYYGCKCYICDMEFERSYGKIGKGFIHVHHIVPLNTIGRDYKVDYIKDLIPVCPNCHAMIHRIIGNSNFSVEEIKDRLISKNKIFINKN